MKMQNQLSVFALVAMCASCGTVSETNNNNPSVAISNPDMSGMSSTGDDFAPVADRVPGVVEMGAPAPGGEVALTTPEVVSPFAHLRTIDQPVLVKAGSTKLDAGRLVGDLVLDQKRSMVTGTGPGLTVVDGNLIVGDGCSVVGLTVTGDVIIRGNGSRVFVDCRGQVLDYGMQNQY